MGFIDRCLQSIQEC